MFLSLFLFAFGDIVYVSLQPDDFGKWDYILKLQVTNANGLGIFTQSVE